MLAPDVWAFGVTLFILLTGLPPWEVDTGPSAADPRYVYVRDGMLRTLLQTWGLPLTEGAMDLLQRCLTADPARRITLGTLVKLSNAFGRMVGAIGVVSENYAELNAFAAVVVRLREFERAQRGDAPLLLVDAAAGVVELAPRQAPAGEAQGQRV